MKTIVIVGGGFNGTIAEILLERAPAEVPQQDVLEYYI